jgi:hypothetical protein
VDSQKPGQQKKRRIAATPSIARATMKPVDQMTHEQRRGDKVQHRTRRKGKRAFWAKPDGACERRGRGDSRSMDRSHGCGAVLWE